MSEKQLYRQGDICFERRDKEIPLDIRVYRDPSGILAKSIQTGHTHQAKPVGKNSTVSLYRRNDQVYLEVVGKGEIVHQEHKPLELPEGQYRVRFQGEFNPTPQDRQQQTRMTD